MSTRATVLFKEDTNPMVKIYHHWDGYPEGFGLELANFFSEIKIINGISSGKDIMFQFGNGFGCAVSQFVSKIKTCVGNVYISTIDSDNEYIDFSYTIDYNSNEEEYSVSIKSYDTEVFNGTMEEFLEFCKNPTYPDEEDEDIPQF